MKIKNVLLGLGIGSALLLVMTAVVIYSQPYTFHGSVIEPPVRAADFVLTTQNDTAFRLSDQRGKVVVLYFGYTSCPDVCPTTLSDLKKVRAQLGNQADRASFVFITIDPERDTTERQRAYLAAFDPTFIGLTGATNDLDPVWKSYGVYHEKRDVGSALGYLVDHSSRVYVLDTRGNLRITYPFGAGIQDIVQDLRHLIGEPS